MVSQKCITVRDKSRNFIHFALRGQAGESKLITSPKLGQGYTLLVHILEKFSGIVHKPSQSFCSYILVCRLWAQDTHDWAIDSELHNILILQCFSDGVLLTARSLDEIIKLKHLLHLGLSRCYNIPPMAFR